MDTAIDAVDWDTVRGNLSDKSRDKKWRISISINKKSDGKKLSSPRVFETDVKAATRKEARRIGMIKAELQGMPLLLRDVKVLYEYKL